MASKRTCPKLWKIFSRKADSTQRHEILMGYTEEDIPRLVREVRSEIAREALERKAS